MSITFEDIISLLKVLTVEQKLALAESLPIPSWSPGTMTDETPPGGVGAVRLDRDLQTATTVSAKNVTGGFIMAGTRVQVCADGGVLLVDRVLDAGFPPGILVPYVGATEPAWGLFANGQTVSTGAPNHRLASALGETGSTMTLPNANDRTIVFKGSTYSTLLAVGGAMSRTIAQANLPAATLTVTITDPGHTHKIGSTVNVSATGSDRQEPGSGTTATSASATTGITASAALGGSGTALDTTPAYLVVNAVLTL